MAPTKTRVFGLVGYPLGHSFSKDFFNKKFVAEGVDAIYKNFELADISEFPDVISAGGNICGLNVTIPYKAKAMAYLDDIDDEAIAIGAVNVIKVMRDGAGNFTRLKGYNTDVIGFFNSINGLIKPSHRKALVLGTGGASKAVFHGLKKLGIKPAYVSRSHAKGCLTYDELTPEVMAEHTVIVNATPLGMHPKVNECPGIPYSLLTPQHICYDLVYNPEVTLFLMKSAEYGAITKNGLEMLLLQALAAWQIWNSER